MPDRVHPFRDVAVVGGFNTRQARSLEGYDGFSICLEAALGALDAAGIPATEVDGVFGNHGLRILHAIGAAPGRGTLGAEKGLAPLVDALSAVAAGTCAVVVVVMGEAGTNLDGASTAPWTRPSNEFVAPFGLHTAVEFALMARRHMHTFGTRPEHLAEVAATIRNNGHVNPEAVYFGRGPFRPEDILASRMVADPFHLLDCAMTAEGASAVVVVRRDRASDLRQPAVAVLGVGADHFGTAYTVPPVWDLHFRGATDVPAGYVGRRAARQAFAMAGLSPEHVDVCELYDPYSFEIIRQYEAFGFCADGEGAAFVMDGNIAPGGRFPTTTDGGLMSFSHCVWGQMLQRVIRGMHQIQGTCATNQVAGAEVALCSAGGSGAMFSEVVLLGPDQP